MSSATYSSVNRVRSIGGKSLLPTSVAGFMAANKRKFEWRTWRGEERGEERRREEKRGEERDYQTIRRCQSRTVYSVNFLPPVSIHRFPVKTLNTVSKKKLKYFEWVSLYHGHKTNGWKDGNHWTKKNEKLTVNTNVPCVPSKSDEMRCNVSGEAKLISSNKTHWPVAISIR